MKKLLVGLDGSSLAETVLPYAAEIARYGRADVTLLRVLPELAPAAPLASENPALLPYMVVMPGASRAERAVETAQDERYEAQHYLDRLVEKLGRQGVAAQAILAAGNPAEVLVSEAAAQGAALLFLATHGRSGLSRLLFGSVAEAVIAQSSVPVFLARAGASAQSPSISDILVPLDGLPDAERALPIAADLARTLDAELTLVEVVVPLAPEPIVDAVLLHPAAGDVIGEEQAAASEYIADAAQRLKEAGLRARVSVQTDDVAVGVARTAADAKSALIVMATHGTTGVVRALAGSTASQVLHQTTLPLVLVGPRGNVTRR
jgi:nucleotide-binding universal stress UspA family protein